MSELPPGVEPAVAPEPRDSAAGIVLRPAPAGGVEVLLGRRSRRSRFMPGHLAFPGGAVEPEDGDGSGDRFARCVAREVREETGIDLPPEAWRAAGVRITPALFPVRFRNAFFVARVERGPAPRPASDEFETLRFADAASVVADWSAGKTQVPPPVLPILRALAAGAATDPAAAIAAVNAEEQRAPRIEFVPGLWMVPLKTATMPPATHTNVWIPGAGDFVVIDPGTRDPAELALLAAVLERRRAVGGRPRAVLLTHGHQDHATGAVALARELDVPLVAHATTLTGLAHRESVECRALDDGEVLDAGGVGLRAVFTPGHHPGHLAFAVEGTQALIAGDLLSGISTILIDPDHGDMQAYLDSLRRVESGGFNTLLPGHGPPLPARALTHLIAHREQREARIVAALDTDVVSLTELARQAYVDVPELPAALTERQTLSHLIRLERLGRARRNDPPGRHWSAA